MTGRKTAYRSIGLVLPLACAWLAAHAEPLISTSRNTYGVPGLVDMPTAESAPDALVSGSYFQFSAANRTTLTFQVSDRLGAAFRYSRIPGIATGGEPLYDRSFDLQYRFVDEKGLRPAIAVGLRDFIGTGIYSSEYFVATKSITPEIRATGGIGWGRLGSHGDWGSPFGSRPVWDGSEGGQANPDQWFKGPVAPFFGVSWAPNEKLTFKLEYSSDGYDKEVAAGELDRKSSVNLGADYSFGDVASVSAYYLYGSEVGFQFNININPRYSPIPSGFEPGPLPVRPRPSPQREPEAWTTDWVSDPEVRPGIQKALAEALAKEGQTLEALSLSATRAEVRITNRKYLAQPEAEGRTARILTRALPPSVETFVITSVERGIPTASVTLKRSDIEATELDGSVEILRSVEFDDALRAGGADLFQTEGIYPRFVWSLTPYVEANFFDPDSPFRADLGLQLGANYEVAPGLIASGLVRKRIVGNLDQSTRSSDSTIPHVRSDLALYQKEGDPALTNLTFAWYARPAPDFYSRVSAGYLESMFGGVSAELLWKPVDSRLALGTEINWVAQRNFDQLFGFQDYNIVTGHASAYYDIGKGFQGQVDVGRYLAGDWGTTIALDRVFANGWRVGAFATLTDLSAEEFGEGSFDKGIRITVPVGWALGNPSTKVLDSTIRPLTRDGGARVNVEGRLFETIRDTHQGTQIERWGRFWR